MLGFMFKGIKLVVGEITKLEDLFFGIVKLDVNLEEIKKIHIKEGDIVEILGKKSTGAIVANAYPEDRNIPLIRMDKLVMKNCGASVGEYVEIRKIKVKNAKIITLEPEREDILVVGGGDLLRKFLLGRPLKTGDIIKPIKIDKKDKEFDVFREFFGRDFESLSFPLIDEKFIVVSTQPEGIVRVTDNTLVRVVIKL